MTHDLSSLGWDETFASAYRRFDRSDATPARVLHTDLGVCTVLGMDGVARASLAGSVLLGAARDSAALPCPGDWVVVRRWPDRRHTVEVVLPRRTALIRRTADRDAGDPEAGSEVLAVNMDTVAVVEPMDPALDDARIERLLALVHTSGARPLVVLSKCDLAADPEAVARQLAAVDPAVPVVAVSVRRGTGLSELRRYVTPGRTLALVGRTGAGKSTLVNALALATVMPAQANRRVNGAGRQPRACRALVPVPDGGAVLDTPGVRRSGVRLAAVGGHRHDVALHRHDAGLPLIERRR